MFNKVAVLGVGLIGASFSLALKEKKLCGEIAGFGRSVENLQNAVERRIIDTFGTDPEAVCRDADLIMLSTPSGSFVDMIRRSSKAFKKGAVVTDAGSVKGDLVHDIELLMPEGVSYIGAHPIAGNESSGIDSASPGLFSGAKCIVTPTKNSDLSSLNKIKGLWEKIGAIVLEMDPQQHDHVYASVSHLPHIIAFTMVNTVAAIDRSYLEFSGQGFKDMTRIAASSPELWRDICMMNRKNLIDMIEIFHDNLDALSRHLSAGDADSLEAKFRNAKILRDTIG